MYQEDIEKTWMAANEHGQSGLGDSSSSHILTHARLV